MTEKAVTAPVTTLSVNEKFRTKPPRPGADFTYMAVPTPVQLTFDTDMSEAPPLISEPTQTQQALVVKLESRTVTRSTGLPY